MSLYGRKVARGRGRRLLHRAEDGIAALARRRHHLRLLLERHEEVRSDNNEFLAVVPFALRVARVVKSADVNPLPVLWGRSPSTALPPSDRSAVFLLYRGDVDDRVKFLLRQRACLARGLAIALCLIRYSGETRGRST